MFKKIFCPIDGSETTSHCLEMATTLAKENNANLMFLHVVDDFYPLLDGLEMANIVEIEKELKRKGQRLLKDAQEKAAQEGVTSETKLVEILGKSIANVIVEEAKTWGADLIVIATHGRRGLNRLMLGSSTEVVVRISPIPVLTTRHPE